MSRTELRSRTVQNEVETGREDEEGEEEDAIELQLEEAGLVQVPDGGYGWVVVLASFLANVLVDGLIFTAGAGFQPQWEEYYGASNGATAWTVSLLSGNYLLAGPIASALAHYYGCKAVTIAGTLLSVTGFIVSIFSPKVWILYITFGIIGGIGFGMIYLPAVVMVSHYFEEKRALATGIAVCGSGIGTMAFAPLINFLLQLYSWQQALLIMAGLTLNGLVSGALYRPLKPTAAQIEDVVEVAQRYAESRGEQHLNNGRVLQEVEVVEETTSPHVAEGVAIERFVPQRASESRRSRSRTSGSDRPFMSVMELRARERQTSVFSVQQDRSSLVDSEGRNRLYKLISQESIAQLNRPLSRLDIFYPGSLQNMNGNLSAGGRRIPGPPSVASGAAQSRRSLMMSTLSMPVLPAGVGWQENLISTLKVILDVSLLKSPSFLIFAVGGIFTILGYFAPYVYLPRHAIAEGHSETSATMLISIIGITNIIGRIACGWLADQKWADALIIHNVAVTLGGVGTIFVPFLSSYPLLVLYSILFGIGTLICVQLMGLERLTSAFGLLLLFMGVAALVGSPIAGSLYDHTGNYHVSFYVMGIFLTLSGLIGIPLRRINKWERERDLLRAMAEEEAEEEGSEEGPLHSQDAHNQHYYEMHPMSTLVKLPDHNAGPHIPTLVEEDEERSTVTNPSRGHSLDQ